MNYTANWRTLALCRFEDPDLFFPAGTEGPSVVQAEHAKAVCRRCPVAEACLDYALTHNVTDGVFGGLTSSERRSIQRRQARGSTAPPMPPAATLAEAIERRTTPTEDGHLLWIGGPHLGFRGQRYTSTQAAFLLGHGRDPVGLVRRTCTESDCVHHDHLTDELIRDAEDICGTRTGYIRHRNRGEDCEACRHANTAADRRLRETGTTKVTA